MLLLSCSVCALLLLLLLLLLCLAKLSLKYSAHGLQPVTVELPWPSRVPSRPQTQRCYTGHGFSNHPKR